MSGINFSCIHLRLSYPFSKGCSPGWCSTNFILTFVKQSNAPPLRCHLLTCTFSFFFFSRCIHDMKPQAGWLVLLVLSLVSLCRPIPMRDSLIEQENVRRTGGNLVLRKWEEQVNKQLISLKEMEVATARNTGYFPPSMHFFKAKGLIDQSAVFSILKRMPKGRDSDLRVPGCPNAFCDRTGIGRRARICQCKTPAAPKP